MAQGDNSTGDSPSLRMRCVNVSAGRLGWRWMSRSRRSYSHHNLDGVCPPIAKHWHNGPGDFHSIHPHLLHAPAHVQRIRHVDVVGGLAKFAPHAETLPRVGNAGVNP